MQFDTLTDNGNSYEAFTKHNHVVILGVIYSACLIASNLVAAKVVSLAGLIFPAATLFFPLTYIFDDVLTEVYGFKVSRRIIWLGLLANCIVTLGTLLAVALPSASFWQEQAAFHTVFISSARIFVASSIAYLSGEFINSIILAKLKVATAGKHLWLRVIASTGVGVGIDTSLFCLIGFWGTMPAAALGHMILAFYLFKFSYEIIALPITYRVTAYLKRADNSDYYDKTTRFNPFSFKL